MSVIRTFLAIVVFIRALDAAAAVNRWWTESTQGYLENIILMTGGFLLFSILAARSKLDFVGFIVLSIAIYFILDYEIGGPSKMYLSPFDPLLGIKPFFEGNRWMGIASIDYRWGASAVFSLLAAFILSVSRTTHSRRYAQER